MKIVNIITGLLLTALIVVVNIVIGVNILIVIVAAVITTIPLIIIGNIIKSKVDKFNIYIDYFFAVVCLMYVFTILSAYFKSYYGAYASYSTFIGWFAFYIYNKFRKNYQD